MNRYHPRIDVIIPVYNGAPYIQKAIETVLRHQAFLQEIIVIDDCSTDQTLNVLREFGQKIRVIRHEKNRGLPAARNTGIRAGNAELIAFLDADDAWIEGKIEKQINVFKENPPIGLCYTDIFDCDSDLNPVGSQRGFRRRESEFVFDELYLDAFPIPPSTVIVRREAFDLCKMFDETMLKAEDYECWLRIAMVYPISCIPEPLCLRRNSPTSITNTSTLEEEAYYTLRAFDLCAEAALKRKTQLPLGIDARKRLYFHRRICESITWHDAPAEEFFRGKLLESGAMSFWQKVELASLKAKEAVKPKIRKADFLGILNRFKHVRL